jgi:hypothetical protein
MADTEIINEQTGEVQSTALAVIPHTSDPYAGIACRAFSPDAIKTVTAPADPARVQIRPDGIVYMEQNEYRRRLTEAFGPGNWGMLPRHVGASDDGSVVIYDGMLFIEGRFVAQAIGEHRYRDNNGNGSYATSAEAAKSDCLTRCAKDLGMFSELWDKDWIAGWLRQYAVEVWCETKEKKKKKLWRKKTAPKIDQFPWKEVGPAESEYTGGIGSRPPERTEAAAPTQTSPDFSKPAYDPATGAAQPYTDLRPPKKITPAQVKRFCALATKHGWTDAEWHKLLAGNLKIDSANDILASDYETLCDVWLLDTERLQRVRAALAREQAQATGTALVDTLAMEPVAGMPQDDNAGDRYQGEDDDPPGDMFPDATKVQPLEAAHG